MKRQKDGRKGSGGEEFKMIILAPYWRSLLVYSALYIVNISRVSQKNYREF